MSCGEADANKKPNKSKSYSLGNVLEKNMKNTKNIQHEPNNMTLKPDQI
jgi:hypothetical protein